MRVKNFKSAFIIILIGSGLFAQRTGKISGVVTDMESGDPLIGVNILIRNTFIGTTTNNEGQFEISDLKPGTYNLIVSMIGYRKEIVKNITIKAEGERFLEIKLEQDVLSSPQIIVTASRKEQDIMESPLSVSVIGIRQIQEKAAVSLVDVLLYEAGVNTVNGQLNIRGASGYTLGAGNRSLLLLDDVPLLGSAAGNITWAVIPTSEIAQVEIVKSGGSAMYGSSAMGGVLNIITRNAPSYPETRLRVKMGGYSEPKYDQWKWRDNPGLFYTTELTHARPLGRHSGWVRIQRRQSDGYSQLNWEDSFNITGKIKFNYGTRYTASLYANYLADQNGLSSQWKNSADPFEAPSGAENDYAKGSKFNLNGFFNYIYSPNLVMKVRGALYDVHWQNSGTNTDFSNENKKFGEYQLLNNWANSLTTTLGVVIQRATIDAKIFGDHNSLSTAVYILAQQRLSRRFTLSGGGRWEDYKVDDKTLDKTIVPQLALNWKYSDWLAFRTSVGGGFRVPTVAELFSQSQLNIFKIEPNPNLQSENSVSYEAGGTIMLPGWGWFPNLKLDAAVFRTDFENLIEPIPDKNGIIHFENITTARIAGAEVDLKTGLFDNKLLVTTAYTFLDPVEVDKRGDVIDTLSYRFRHTLVTTATAYWRNFSATMEYRYSGRMDKTELFDENQKTGSDKRVPIHLWNAGAGYTRGSLEYLFRVENIFQYYYVELERNMGTERNFSLTISKIF